jgi:hypothetical protein
MDLSHASLLARMHLEENASPAYRIYPPRHGWERADVLSRHGLEASSSLCMEKQQDIEGSPADLRTISPLVRLATLGKDHTFR